MYPRDIYCCSWIACPSSNQASVRLTYARLVNCALTAASAVKSCCLSADQKARSRTISSRGSGIDTKSHQAFNSAVRLLFRLGVTKHTPIDPSMHMVFNRCRLSAPVGRAADSTVLCVRVCQGRDPPYEANSWFLHGMSGSDTATSTGAKSLRGVSFRLCFSPRLIRAIRKGGQLGPTLLTGP